MWIVRQQEDKSPVIVVVVALSAPDREIMFLDKINLKAIF